jgi:hypothetical protein
MHATGPIAQRFPLVARSRPACIALSARITGLTALADRASADQDLTLASRVLNQGALIASDCGQPDLARDWCHRHAHAYLDSVSLAADVGRLALEPLINLARLLVRDGNGAAAYTLIDGLYTAATDRADTVDDGVVVPIAALTATTDLHRNLCRWLWGVHLADGTRALSAAGRWDDAQTHLHQYQGIGRRMLDGRQVAVIAHIVAGKYAAALHLLADSEPGEVWEQAVTAVLTTLCREGRPTDALLDTAVDLYQRLDAATTPIVFRTRLAWSIADAARPGHPTCAHVVADAMAAAIVAADGYAARDLLQHERLGTATRDRNRGMLAEVLRDSGLDQPMTALQIGRLETAMAACLQTIRSPTVRV